MQSSSCRIADGHRSGLILSCQAPFYFSSTTIGHPTSFVPLTSWLDLVAFRHALARPPWLRRSPSPYCHGEACNFTWSTRGFRKTTLHWPEIGGLSTSCTLVREGQTDRPCSQPSPHQLHTTPHAESVSQSCKENHIQGLTNRIQNQFTNTQLARSYLGHIPCLSFLNFLFFIPCCIFPYRDSLLAACVWYGP